MMRRRVASRVFVVAACVLGAAVLTHAGAVVEGLGRELKPEIVALKAGDTIAGWSRGGQAGEIRSVFDLGPVALEQLPRGPVTLDVIREGQRTTVVVPPRAWPFEIEVRPELDAVALALYEQGRADVRNKKTEEGARIWRDVVERLRTSDPTAACWLLARIGWAWGDAARRAEFDQAYAEALECAHDREPGVAAGIRAQQVSQALERSWADLLEPGFGALLEHRKEHGVPLAHADALYGLSYARYVNGHTDEALDLVRQALAIQEAEAPESLVLVRSLSWLAFYLAVVGDVDEAERVFVRAEALASRVAPGGRAHVTALTGLGGAIVARNDLVATQRVWERAFELCPPETAQQASLLLNLSMVAAERGDLEAADSWAHRGLELSRRLGHRRSYAGQLTNLGVRAWNRGRLEEAEQWLRQALTVSEGADSYGVVEAFSTLGRVRLERGDPAEAKALYQQAVAYAEKASVQGLHLGLALLDSGDLARREGDGPGAEAHYRRALSTLPGPEPNGPIAARGLHGLGTLEQARGRREDAAAFFTRAVEALEAVRGVTGGSDQARALRTAQHYAIYHDHAELLLGMGRTEEAYRILELCRSRSLLALLAERDLLLDDEIPRELEERRRRVEAAYQRTHQKLRPLKAADPAREPLARRLIDLRREQIEIADRIRSASPRLAEARYPEPLSAAQIQASLEPGTLLLAYSVGERSTLLFGVAADGLHGVILPIGEADLRRRVDAWRREIEKGVPRPAFYSEARALYDLLLRPMEGRLRAARRFIVSPGGSLHALPFAALMRDGRFLAEWKPITFVPSGTIQAQWAPSRRQPGPASTMVVFADPLRPAAGMAALPESRREAAAVATGWPRPALHLGEAATESRAKQLSKDARYVHFACHAIVDEARPLDSGLVLQAGSKEDDGLLQAWEIYERVRLDADLVTLSACHSGAGKPMAGEGLLGLTRAFQYAGARSVLASLWAVPDRSTVEWMRTFYDGLRRGLAKDEAVCQAQRAAIRKGGVASRPFRWAGFQLFGDGK